MDALERPALDPTYVQCEAVANHRDGAVDYRRYHRSGALVFLTLVTRSRASVLVEPRVRDVFRSAITHVAQRHPFRTVAYAVMPDHCHLLWRMPLDDGDFSRRVRLLKHFMTRQQGVPRPLWQARFWDHMIRDESDFVRHLDYIHFNPVKHGHCAAAAEWPDSSYGHYVRKGWYAPDWGVASAQDARQFGE